jgi:hypothetical protein
MVVKRGGIYILGGLLHAAEFEESFAVIDIYRIYLIFALRTLSEINSIGALALLEC